MCVGRLHIYLYCPLIMTIEWVHVLTVAHSLLNFLSGSSVLCCPRLSYWHSIIADSCQHCHRLSSLFHHYWHVTWKLCITLLGTNKTLSLRILSLLRMHPLLQTWLLWHCLMMVPSVILVIADSEVSEFLATLMQFYGILLWNYY
jgi:hypothetical protein